MTELKDKVVLITGSSSGIGRATAISFAKQGASVGVNYRENKQGAEAVAKEINKLGAKALIIKADVSKPDEVKMMFDQVISEFRQLDILINNAAIPTDKVPFLDASFDDLREMIDTDLIGPMVCSQQAVRIMRKQGHGKILNTGSVRGWEYGGRAEVYAASKAGLHSLTRTLAKEVAPEIQVNAVAPGFVKTRVYDTAPPERIDSFMGQTYLKRFIEPDEIADAFIFLAKNDAVTGQVIYVEAGFMLT